MARGFAWGFRKQQRVAAHAASGRDALGLLVSISDGSSSTTSTGGVLAWREGVTDQALVPSTSTGFDSGPAASSVAGSRGVGSGPRRSAQLPPLARVHNGAAAAASTQLRQAARGTESRDEAAAHATSAGGTVADHDSGVAGTAVHADADAQQPGPETQGTPLNQALALPPRNGSSMADGGGSSSSSLGVVVDLSASVTRWLGGGSSSLGDWLRAAFARSAVPDLETRPESQGAAGHHGTRPEPGEGIESAAAPALLSAELSAAASAAHDAHALDPYDDVDLELELELGCGAAAGAEADAADGPAAAPARAWGSREQAEAWGAAVAASALVAAGSSKAGGDSRLQLAPPPARRGRPAVASAAASAAAGSPQSISSHSSSSLASSSSSNLLPLVADGHAAADGVVGDVGSTTAASLPPPPQLLTAALTRAATWQELAALVTAHDTQLDSIHVSAVLVRLAKLYRADPYCLLKQPAAAARGEEGAALQQAGWMWRRRQQLRLTALHPQLAEVVDGLLLRLPGLMPRAGPRTVSNMLWALGVLSPLLRNSRAAAGAAGAAAATRVAVRRAQPRPLQPVTRLGHLRPSVAAAAPLLAAKMRHFWRQAGPQALALTVWGCGRLRLRPGPVWMSEFEAASGRLLVAGGFSARQLSYSLWALAALRLRPEAMWLAAARRALAASAAAAASAATSARTEGSGAEQGLEGHAEAATAADAQPQSSGEVAGLPSTQALATMLWACVVLHVKLDAATEAAVAAGLAARLAAEGATAGPQALAMSLWACARLGVRPQQQLLTAWRGAASAELLAAAPARSISSMLWALAALRAAPPGAWVDAAAAALLLRAQEGALGPQALCNSVGALAQLDCRVSAAWLDGFSAALSPQLLRRLAPSELGVLLHGLGRLAAPHSSSSSSSSSSSDVGSSAGGAAAATVVVVVADEFLAAADAAAAAALPVASPDDLVGICGGLRSLGLRRADGGAAAGGAAAASMALQQALVRRSVQLLQAGALGTRHAAEALACLSAFCGPAMWERRPAAAAHTERQLQQQELQSEAADAEAEELDSDCDGEVTPELGHEALQRPQPLVGAHAAQCAGQRRRRGWRAGSGTSPRKLVLELVRRVVTARLGQTDVFDVVTALTAAAELGLVAQSPAARRVIMSAVARAAGRTPGARQAAQLLAALRALRVAPPLEWVRHVASEAGSKLRSLGAVELESLLRLMLVAPGCVPAAPAAAAATAAAAPEATAVATPPPVVVLLSASQLPLATAPIQHLLDLAGAVVAAGVPAAALPRGWLAALEAATHGRMAQRCVSAGALVQLLAGMACMGHVPGGAWMATWHEATAARLPTLSPPQLAVALRLQATVALVAAAPPPAAWLRAAAAALAAAAAAGGLAPVDVLAAVADLQRLGYQDDAAAGAAAAPPVSSLVAAAAAQLHAQMLVAEPAAQLETLARLQVLSAAPSAPARAVAAAEGWAVGVLDMAHAVITQQRPLHVLLAALQPQHQPSLLSPTSSTAEESGADDAAPAHLPRALPAAAAASAVAAPGEVKPLVLLLCSMVRWGHCPGARWLAGVARHVCRQLEAAADGDCCDVEADAASAASAGSEFGAASGPCWSAADGARAVCCLAALGYVPSAEVAARLQRQLEPALAAAELPAPLAAELCGAWCAVRRRPPPSWWRAALAGSLSPSRLVALDYPDLIRLPYSLAACGHVPPQRWLEAHLQLLPAALAGAASSAATASAGSSSSSSSSSSVVADDLANLAWSLGSAVHEGSYPPGILSAGGALQALLAAARPALPCMGPGQLVLLVEGLARSRHRLPPPFAEAFTSQVARQLQACGASDLVSVLYCLAFLDARPHVPRPWLAAALQRTAQLLPGLLTSPEEAYRADDLAWAVAELDPPLMSPPSAAGTASGGGEAGELSRPFLALLQRQRAALAAAAAAAERMARERDRGDGGSSAGGSVDGPGPSSGSGGGDGGAAGIGRRRRRSPPRRGGGLGGAGVALEEAAVALELPSITSAAGAIAAAASASAAAAAAGSGSSHGSAGAGLAGTWRGRGILGGSKLRFKRSKSPSGVPS
ncbi:hypothetical protein HXX76_003306 [Chlamydomonas incerta]|uniref:RAP domain-containing protein n=1 Tax=Chlamydomonas incerta TaxID=51695 RepID=A0A835TMM9_CHLIN|nr:hypothetical protein HXX76_003306 [Chlamydomonas incerta]|eukprot:KAG2441690.1 hypothetical protein HXX76_003306 [Chlamydomonas incerta]